MKLPIQFALLFLALLALLLLLSGCEPNHSVRYPEKQELAYEVVVIEGCEYVWASSFREKSLAHKGNCTNKIHRYQLETPR